MMTRRAVILNTVIIGAFVVILFRLFDLMIINHGRLKLRAEVQHYKKERKEVVRGLILDRRGRELAVNLDAESIFCRPQEIESPERYVMTLSRFLDKRPEVIRAKLSSKQRFLWIERGVKSERIEPLKRLALRGIGFIKEPKRYYPKHELASHIIGFVNIDQKGIEGIELMYDSQLRAVLTRASLLRDANGRYLSDGLDEPKGNNIVLTIDEGLQYISEKSLEKALSVWQAKWGVIIMMDPFTGEILSMAVRPAYDPNNFNKYEASSRRNRAITDSYEPGSTFKLVTAAGALEEGIVTTDTKIDCQGGKIRIGHKVIEDVHPSGVLTFKEVIERSSNVGTIKVAQKLGPEKLFHYAKRFGFGSKTGIDMPGESSGYLRPPDKWSAQSMGAIPIGYEVAVTPLQVLRAYAAVANGGWLVTPHVVATITAPDGTPIYRLKYSAQRIISSKTAFILKEILTGTVHEDGTARLAGVDGNTVAGKTGTTRLFDPELKTYSRDRYVSSFVGFVPAEEPRIVAIVVIGEPKGGYYGGTVAAPVFRELAEATLAYMRVPREDMPEIQKLKLIKKPGVWWNNETQ